MEKQKKIFENFEKSLKKDVGLFVKDVSSNPTKYNYDVYSDKDIDLNRVLYKLSEGLDGKTVTAPRNEYSNNMFVETKKSVKDMIKDVYGILEKEYKDEDYNISVFIGKDLGLFYDRKNFDVIKEEKPRISLDKDLTNKKVRGGLEKVIGDIDDKKLENVDTEINLYQIENGDLKEDIHVRIYHLDKGKFGLNVAHYDRS